MHCFIQKDTFTSKEVLKDCFVIERIFRQSFLMVLCKETHNLKGGKYFLLSWSTSQASSTFFSQSESSVFGQDSSCFD
jgi:hypothetical protein